MKKIINGKMYNTETASLVAKYSSPHYQGDAHNIEEELYQKTTGEYFIHGQGGAMTRYCSVYANSFSSGSDIIPMDTESAKQWVASRCSVDTYIRIFGEVEE